MTEDSRTAAKPPRWDYQDDPDRAQLYHTFGQLLKLRHENDIFKSPYTQVEMDVVNESRRIKLTNSGLETGKAIVIGNFGINGRDVYPNFHNTGTWFNALTGEAYPNKRNFFHYIALVSRSRRICCFYRKQNRHLGQPSISGRIYRIALRRD